MMRSLLVWGLALGAVAFITMASYPGYMSYDVLQDLRQARSAVEGNQYPPFSAYVWRLMDTLSSGPALMHFVQTAILFLSAAFLIARTRAPLLLQLAVIVVLAIAPPLLGTTLVVWKDVAVGACFMLGAALLFAICPTKTKRTNFWLAFVAAFFIWCGMAYRFNAAPAALPLLLLVGLQCVRTDAPRRWFKAVVVGTVVFLLFFALVWVVNNFRLPTFERLARNTNADSIMTYDLIGISVFSGQSVIIGKDGESIDVKYLQSIYDPRHLNITGINDKEGRVLLRAEIGREWVSAIISHPMAYIRHRNAVFQEYIGLHGHEVFYVTHGNIDENKLGVEFAPTAFKTRVVQELWESRLTWTARAYIYYLVAGLACLLALVLGAKAYRREWAVFFMSGLFYVLPMYVLSPAADLRYNFWAIVAACMATFFALAGIFARYASNAGELGVNNYVNRGKS
ncbi:hypothetical protein P3W66_21630 [Achromobacter denitrificans]|uniref:hypothetical protein n=1 Tax=Achromobacter denitrificans TaxID=32002 RepID=UPI0023E81024|nr:hypothetical protein [Achromobacter denitrificans]MDF3942667.1 hypothetical protein [Achromobacter denitrificans]